MITLIKEKLKQHHAIIKNLSYTVDIQYNEKEDEFTYHYELSFRDDLTGKTVYMDAKSNKAYECPEIMSKQFSDYFKHSMYNKKK